MTDAVNSGEIQIFDHGVIHLTGDLENVDIVSDYEEFVGEERTNSVSEPKRDYHEDWDYWGDSDAMEWGDSEGKDRIKWLQK